MKKLLALTALFVMLSAALAVAAPYTITVTHIVDEAHSWHKACEFFKQEVEKRSDGKIEVKIYPNSQLGNEIDTIQSALTGGGVDVVITGESMMTYVPELGILGVPYLMTSDAHVEAVAGGEIGKEIENLMLMDGAGFRCLAYFVRGPRDVTANKAIRTPDDIKGVIIRTPASTITVSTFEAFGAKPTPMAFSEVFTSLQSGTIQGQENPLAMIKSGNFYEVQKYLCKTEHLRTWLYFALSEQTFQSLPADLQKVVLEVGKEMQKYEHELFLKDEAELEGFLKSKGMEIINDVDQAAFAKLADGAMQKLMAGEYSYLKPLYDKIKAAEPK
ncbi:MAG: TRAP transporter substrate-binding protein [Synergistaceae bacterium]|nr:TRAP transporter substrate-binding protein [Synergistaceae bacterium]